MNSCASPYTPAELGAHVGVEVGPDKVAHLETFCQLLRKWQKAQNLVSRETLGAFWQRHVLDSLQLVPLVSPEARRLIDLGSGGGLPAIPLAIALSDRDLEFMLIEANARKCSFLRNVARACGLSDRLQVINRRIEASDSRETGLADVVTARALAPLPLLLEFAFPLMRPGGVLLFPKGREHGEELAAADSGWQMDVIKHSSITDRDSAVLELHNVRRRGD